MRMFTAVLLAFLVGLYVAKKLNRKNAKLYAINGGKYGVVEN